MTHETASTNSAHRSFIAAHASPIELAIAYLTLAAADVMLTTWILSLGGVELNVLADRILQQFGTPGLAVLKLSTVVVVFGCVGAVWARSQPAGRRLAKWAIVLSLFPIVVALIQIGARFSPLGSSVA